MKSTVILVGQDKLNYGDGWLICERRTNDKFFLYIAMNNQNFVVNVDEVELNLVSCSHCVANFISTQSVFIVSFKSERYSFMATLLQKSCCSEDQWTVILEFSLVKNSNRKLKLFFFNKRPIYVSFTMIFC